MAQTSEGRGCLEEGCLGLPGFFPDISWTAIFPRKSRKAQKERENLNSQTWPGTPRRPFLRHPRPPENHGLRPWSGFGSPKGWGQILSCRPFICMDFYQKKNIGCVRVFLDALCVLILRSPWGGTEYKTPSSLGKHKKKERITKSPIPVWPQRSPPQKNYKSSQTVTIFVIFQYFLSEFGAKPGMGDFVVCIFFVFFQGGGVFVLCTTMLNLRRCGLSFASTLTSLSKRDAMPPTPPAPRASSFERRSSIASSSSLAAMSGR